MTPDIKAIREANTGTDCSANIHPATVIALCDEVERLRLPYDWYPHSKDWRDSPQERGEWLHTMYQQSKRREAELDAEVESLRNGMFNIANQSTEPAIQEFARSYLGDKL